MKHQVEGVNLHFRKADKVRSQVTRSPTSQRQHSSISKQGMAVGGQGGFLEEVTHKWALKGADNPVRNPRAP